MAQQLRAESAEQLSAGVTQQLVTEPVSAASEEQPQAVYVNTTQQTPSLHYQLQVSTHITFMSCYLRI